MRHRNLAIVVVAATLTGGFEPVLGAAQPTQAEPAAASPAESRPGATLERTYTGTGATVTLSLSATKFLAADHVTLTVKLEHEPGLAPAWPAIGDTLGALRIVGRSDTPAELVAGAGGTSRLTTSRRLTLEAPLPGRYQIPAMEFRFRTTSAAAASAPAAFTVATMPIDIEVESVAGGSPESADPGALRGVVGISGRRLPIAWIVAGSAAAAAILSISLTAWVRSRRRLVAEIDPLVRLKTRLRRLDEGAAAGDIPQERFYTELSGVIREYLSLSLNIPAPDLTTEELTPRLRAEPRLAEHGAGLIALLARCDMAKFAADRPGSARAREDVRQVEAFIAAMESVARSAGTPTGGGGAG
jgi:hypothetical protein